MESYPPDAECLARSLTEPNAFEPIFDRHFASVHGYLHRRAGRDLADELAAETFALAFERRASCRAEGTVLPWLYGIATNLLRRRRRTEVRRLRAYGRSASDRSVVYDDDDDAAARADTSAAGALLARALAAMRPRERDALLLYALAGLNYEEIALALDVPVGTVRTWLHRARGVAQRELATEPDVFPLATSGADLHG
jgi:RNA polymerase sigma-70 factor (ECF subfamily)